MKIGLIVLIVCFLSVLVIAHDLATAARKERTRRSTVTTQQDKAAPIYTNVELDRYHRESSERLPVPTRRKPPRIPPRDMAKEQAYWKKENQKHQRELARLDARIRRLEWRLVDCRARTRPGERLRDEPAIRALEETLEAMHKERRDLIHRFEERGRKAGALPGWLR